MGNGARYTCPVCGYVGLDEPPRDHSICESCGTHFGYDDCNTSHGELRERWIAGGRKWWSRYKNPDGSLTDLGQQLKAEYDRRKAQ